MHRIREVIFTRKTHVNIREIDFSVSWKRSDSDCLFQVGQVDPAVGTDLSADASGWSNQRSGDESFEEFLKSYPDEGSNEERLE